MKTIYFNGNVYTGDEALVSAFAVENGKFVFAGSDAEAKALAAEGDTLTDLGGKFVCAGFNDSHIQGGQLVGLGRALLRRQVGRPLDQRLNAGNVFGLVHDDQPHGLTVGTAGRKPHGLDDIIHHILRDGFLRKTAVGAAGNKRLHNRHL